MHVRLVVLLALSGALLLSLGAPESVAAAALPKCTITGTPERDILRGTPGRDVICAGAGNDVLVGGTGNDVLIGGKGHDDLSGGRGDDLILGGRGDDLLDGGKGRDDLRGGLGEDVLSGGKDNDRIDGGRDHRGILLHATGTPGDCGPKPGGCVICGWNAPPCPGMIGRRARLHPCGLYVDLRRKSMHSCLGRDRLHRISMVVGSDRRDRITLGRHRGEVDSHGGPDHIVGGPSRDRLDGGVGRNIIRGGNGGDGIAGGKRTRAWGGRGRDAISLTTGGRSRAYGGPGRDTIHQADRAFGGPGNDYVAARVLADGGAGALDYCDSPGREQGCEINRECDLPAILDMWVPPPSHWGYLDYPDHLFINWYCQE